MTSEIKNICNRIENLMTLYHENNHDLLYEKTLIELQSVNFNGIFINLNNLTLHRVRLNNVKDEIFENIEELHYAPQKCVCSFGRVNRPGQSMFYCSEFSSICDLELLHDYLLKNDIGHERLATYSEWEIKTDLDILILAIAPSNREFVNGLAIRNDCIDFVKTKPESTHETYCNFYSLTSHFFEKNAKNNYSVYVVCSAIANYFTLQFPNIDGLIYPTVQGNIGYNIVLRPHVLDNKMIIPKKEVFVQKWIITNKNSMTIDNNFHKIGRIKKDKIIWTY